MLWSKGTKNKANHNISIGRSYLRPVGLQWCKGTKNKANHNALAGVFAHAFVGCYGAKVLKIKQITTDNLKIKSRDELDAMVQRY